MENYKIKKCFVRYEPNINNGTMFLFNKDNGKMLKGNLYSYLVAKSLINNYSLDKLIDEICLKTGKDKCSIEENVNLVIDYLDKEGFLEK